MTPSTFRRTALVPIAVAGVLPLAAAVPGPAAAASGPVPIAQHLNNPRQMAFGADGTLYVAEAGSGKMNATIAGRCFGGAEGKTCVGNTSSLTAVAHPDSAGPGNGRRVIKGLLSLAAPDGSGAVGLDAVTVSGNGSLYGIMTAAPPSLLPKALAWQTGQLLQFVNGRTVPLANIGNYSYSRPNPGHGPDTNPYGVAAAGGSVYVADAGNNTLLKVTNGRISTVQVFHYQHGSKGFDSVPTSVVKGMDGMLYVGELASFVPGAAHVYVINPRTGRIVRTISGLTTVTGIAVDEVGTVYAAELQAGCAPGAKHCVPGRLVTIPHYGHRTYQKVPLPGGVAVDSHRHVFVSVLAVVPGGGMVWRLS